MAMSARSVPQLVSRSFIAFSALFFLCAGRASVFGERPKQKTGQSAKIGAIGLGTSLKEVKAILAAAKVPSAGMRQFAAHPDGDKWLFHSIRKGKVDLVVRYAPNSQQVTGLTLYFVGYPRSKMSDVAVSASAIQFNSDGSYWVLFPPDNTSSSLPRVSNQSFDSAVSVTVALERRWPIDSIGKFCIPERRHNAAYQNLVTHGDVWQGVLHQDVKTGFDRIYWYGTVVHGRLNRYSLNVRRGDDYWLLEIGSPQSMSTPPNVSPDSTQPYFVGRD